ncbi:MAG: DUF2088 domain-containing protein [Spirochaetaceae bacterium]|nr:MAG: DUF2088 domain-containing protein [Spirochaetaceae bacterium]
MLQDVALPRMVRARQFFDAERVASIQEIVSVQLARPEIARTVKPGASVAVTVGSRGIANVASITREIVRNLKELGAKPFVIPAMGSHGGGNAEGQEALLAGLGVTEETVEAPIRSSMEVVTVGALEDGRPVFVDRIASDADGIVVAGRIKPHTSYRGLYESGLFKMIAIGLGKHRGAQACHDQGFGKMDENVALYAKAILSKTNILFGLAIIENAYDETCKILAVESDRIEAEEPRLLQEARERMAQIYIREFDLLVVDEIGKNHSGDGMDPNITGSYSTEYAYGPPDVKHYVVLDVSDASHGNINGLGRADFTTKRVFDKADFDAVYPNALTAKVPIVAKVPMVLETDKLAIQAAVMTCEGNGSEGVRLVRIHNSSHVGEILVSENLVQELERHPKIEILSQPTEMEFDAEGNLVMEARRCR